MRQLVVIAKDRKGLLADVSGALAAHGINIDSLSAESLRNNAVIRISTKDEKSAKKALETAGYKVFTSDVLVVQLSNQPGELSKVARLLADSQINIENVHMLFQSDNKGFYAIKTDKAKKASDILADAGYL